MRKAEQHILRFMFLNKDIFTHYTIEHVMGTLFTLNRSFIQRGFCTYHRQSKYNYVKVDQKSIACLYGVGQKPVGLSAAKGSIVLRKFANACVHGNRPMELGVVG